MDALLKEKIESRIEIMGLQKKFVAKKIGLDAVRFSQTLAGKRKLTDMEYTGLKNLLTL